MAFQTETLSNGLRIIHVPTGSPVTYCGFATNVGTRDEQDDQQGMAHFVEHNIFKGTHKRRAWHILNRMENVGGNLDAFTGKEETIVYIDCLKEDFYRAAELLTDIVFHSIFPQAEIDKEVEVIIDEIQSYEDSPSELIYDDIENMLFKGHSLGRNILGKPELLRHFKTADALVFTKKFYHPENMVFFVQGNHKFKRIVSLLDKLTSDLPKSPFTYQRIPILPYHPQRVMLQKNTHQDHVMIGCRGYGAKEKKQSVLYLLNNILGGPGMNSRLNVSLRERHGLVYTVEANITAYTDTGVFSIYFGCDRKDTDRCLELTKKELKKLKENKLTTLQLDAAKKQLIGQLGVAGDNFENNALEMGKIFLHYNRYDEPEEIYDRIRAITAKEIQEVANEKFDESYLSFLIYKGE
ncbi:MAG: M16 family metallopeptidase [Phocaeicola sp.]|uniref:M16 family metallopeptidase n=1 Tax=Phocaeicola TaxID=909656 RepID=UPI00234EC5DB|nr:pitrilysin family protein [Phocaeicola oris]MCE2616877.1 insulinase family protein [Phocaeicola oris]